MRHLRVPFGNPARLARRLALALVALAAGFVVAAAGQEGDLSDGPWHGVTVTDAHGWTLRNVSLYVSGDEQGLVIVRADGAEKQVAFADVVLVLDAGGRDITEEVLTGVPTAEALEPAPPAADPGMAPEFAVEQSRAGRRGWRRQAPGTPPPFSFALEAGGGASSLMGDWFWGFDDGAFTQFGARLAGAGRGYLHLLYRHQNVGGRDYFYYDYPPPPSEVTMQSFQLMYGRNTASNGSGALVSQGYFEGGGGVMRLRESGSGYFQGISRFAFAMQAGLWLRVDRDLAIDLAIHAFYKPGWLDEYEAGGVTLGLQACLMYLGH